MSNYEERDIVGMDKRGNYYLRHVSAMTSEGLHNKSAIAAELGYRDEKIAILEDENAKLKKNLLPHKQKNQQRENSMELRWLVSTSKQAPPMTELTIIGPGGPSPITVTHKKLQYRKLIATLEGESIQWTEWEDVPFVDS